VDLFCALTAKTAMGVPAVRVGARGPDSSSPSKTELQPVQVKRLAAVILTGLVVSHVTGIFAAGPPLVYPVHRLADLGANRQ
jgi:hypothetical protein